MTQPQAPQAEELEYRDGAQTFYVNHFGLAVGDREAILELGQRLPTRIRGKVQPIETRTEIVARIVLSRQGLESLEKLIHDTVASRVTP